jgi:hypothetical protein
MAALDLEALARPKRMLFDLLEQPAAHGAAHLIPANTWVRTIVELPGIEDPAAFFESSKCR